MSERVGSDIELLWIWMTSSSIDFGSLPDPTLSDIDLKMEWNGSGLPLNERIVVCFNRWLSCSISYLSVHFRLWKMTILYNISIFTLCAFYFRIRTNPTKIRISTAFVKTFFLKYRLRSNNSRICYWTKQICSIYTFYVFMTSEEFFNKLIVQQIELKLV